MGTRESGGRRAVTAYLPKTESMQDMREHKAYLAREMEFSSSVSDTRHFLASPVIDSETHS